MTPMMNKNKQVNKQTSNMAQTRGTSWSQVEHSTTETMCKEVMIHEFSSFQLMLR